MVMAAISYYEQEHFEVHGDLVSALHSALHSDRRQHQSLERIEFVTSDGHRCSVEGEELALLAGDKSYEWTDCPGWWLTVRGRRIWHYDKEAAAVDHADALEVAGADAVDLSAGTKPVKLFRRAPMTNDPNKLAAILEGAPRNPDGSISFSLTHTSAPPPKGGGGGPNSS